MNLVTATDNTDTQHTDIQLTLSLDEAHRLRVAVPWLLRALAERPTTPARMRERRLKAYTALESLLTALSDQLPPSEQIRESQ
jgi:hypothetical protein